MTRVLGCIVIALFALNAAALIAGLVSSFVRARRSGRQSDKWPVISN